MIESITAFWEAVAKRMHPIGLPVGVVAILIFLLVMIFDVVGSEEPYANVVLLVMLWAGLIGTVWFAYAPIQDKDIRSKNIRDSGPFMRGYFGILLILFSVMLVGFTFELARTAIRLLAE